MQELNRGLAMSRTDRRGSVMVAALLSVMVGTGLLMGLMQMSVSLNREYSSRYERERAHALAESGLAEAVVAMRRGGTGVVGSEAVPAVAGGGLVWTTVEQVGGGLRRVVASAAVGPARVALEQMVFHYSTDLLDTAIFAREELRVEANVLIDSFNSKDGTYEDQLKLAGDDHVSEAAIVQSNGDVIADAAVKVHGDVHPGRGDDLYTASNTLITNSQESMAEDRVFNPVDVPPIPMGGPVFLSGSKNVLPPGDYGTTGLYLWKNSKLVVQGPTRIVLGEWVVNSNAEVVLDASGGPIEIYALGDVDLRSNSTLETPVKSALGVTLYLAGDETQEATLNSNSDFYGRIYGPDAEVDIRSNFEIYGAVLADRLILNSYARVHYDEGLRELITDIQYVPGRVSPATFPSRRLLVNRRDPFSVLGLNPAALPTPNDAHEMP